MKNNVIVDKVFLRLAEGCPNKANYKEKDGQYRCLENGKHCTPENCGPYHWFKR